MTKFLSGVLVGIILAIILIFIACVQMWPKWKDLGFIRATNAEERQKNLPYQNEMFKGIYKFWWIGIFVYPIYRILTWFVNEGILAGAVIGFLIVFLPGYILTCFLLDYLTRMNIIKL